MWAAGSCESKIGHVQMFKLREFYKLLTGACSLCVQVVLAGIGVHVHLLATTTRFAVARDCTRERVSRRSIRQKVVAGAGGNLRFTNTSTNIQMFFIGTFGRIVAAASLAVIALQTIRIATVLEEREYSSKNPQHK
jgi:hypothetical protein